MLKMDVMKEVGMLEEGFDEDRARACGAIDSHLRCLATKRSLLDGDEARALREAERLEVHEQFGFGSLLSYLEHVFGYTPRVALDRLRVARALDNLPQLTSALDANEVCYTAVRELTRVATHETERAWLDEARGKSVGVIANLVAGHKQGDKPTDAPNPAIVERPYNLDLLPEVVARLREVRADMDNDVGRRVTDSELMIALCEAWMTSAPVDATDDESSASDSSDGNIAADDAEPTVDHNAALVEIISVMNRPAIEYDLAEMADIGRNRRPAVDNGRARYQVAISLCPSCAQGNQDGGGLAVPVRVTTIARAECDAQRIGSLDGDAPARATQDIPPSTRRFVFRRDHNRCHAPGCRAHRHLEVHHVVPRSNGGSNEVSNLTLLCGGCHTRVHEGTLKLLGRAPGLELIRAAPRAEANC